MDTCVGHPGVFIFARTFSVSCNVAGVGDSPSLHLWLWSVFLYITHKRTPIESVIIPLVSGERTVVILWVLFKYIKHNHMDTFLFLPHLR